MKRLAAIDHEANLPYPCRPAPKQMKKDFYQEIIKKAKFGYAHHEIMLDEHGKPNDYRYLDVNQAFRDLTGIKDKHIVGKTVTGLIPGIRSEKLDWIDFCGKIALEGGEVIFEQYSEHLGKWYQVQAYSTEKFFFTAIFTDISERKQAEKELKEYEERTNQLLRQTRTTLFELDPDGLYIYLSPSVQEMTGYTADELAGKKHFYDIVPEEYRNVEKESALQQMRQQLKFSSLISPLEKKDGTTLWMETSAIPILNKDGTLLKYRGTSTDITERYLAEEALKKSEEKFRIVANNTYNWGFWESPEGEFLHHSPACEEITGYSAEELYRDYNLFLDLIHPDDRQAYLDHWKEVKEQRKKGIHRFRITTRAGQVKHIEHRCRPVFDEDQNYRGIRGTNLDVTERVEAKEKLVKAMEKAEEASRLKTAFIDNITHELRTPLNGIIGFGQLLAQSNITSDERKSYYKSLKNSSDRLIQTVTDFLDISTLVSGNVKVNHREFALKHFLNEQKDRVSSLSASKGVDVRLDLPPEARELNLHSDDELLGKAMAHLLDNAIKFTSEGSISIGYQVKGSFAEIFVRDQGIGISQEKLGTIFEPFIQEDFRMTRGYEGSGLGLAIVQGIANLLGGIVRAESEKGKGSTFYLSIPFDDKQQEPVPQAPSGTIARQTVDKPLILVAEDEESNYTLVKVILGKEGCEILHAKNGQEAIELCKANPEINLVLMDIKMPVMNGLEATRQIKEFRPGLPIVAVTAYLRSGDEQLIRDAGCDGFCRKPFTRACLLETLGKYLEKA